MRENAAAEAEERLEWSRNYLKKAKRRRFAMRTLMTLLVASALALCVYAANESGMLAIPAMGGVDPDTSASRTSIDPDSSGASQSGSTGVSTSPAAPDADARTCTVTYDARGGTMAESVVSIASGSVLTEPGAPTRDGYTFAGWYTDVARTVAWDFAKSAVTRDMTLYARWQAVEPTAAVLPQTGVTTDISLWAAVLAVSLCLAAVLALLLRRVSRTLDHGPRRGF